MFRYAKRAALAATCIAALAFSFAYFSRYPDLNRKAMMAESGTVSDTISMFPVLEVKANDPFWKKVAFTTVNWAHDNRRGMAFGITLGALFLALFRYVSFQPVRSRWANSALGMLIGTPLGVCVNCAAPVFKGALQSRRVELAIAVMLSSPTLNIIVVTMVFSLFPFYMAVGKLLVTLVTVLLFVPLLSKRLAHVPVRDFAKLPQADAALGEDAFEGRVSEGVVPAVVGFVKDFFKSLWHVFVRTAPWMLVAGFLGALLSHLFRLDALQNAVGLPTLLLTTLVGLAIPVPMAFDVVLTHALHAAGLPLPLVFALLCSLGSFSLYSFVITWKSAAPQWAVALVATFFVVIAGVSWATPSLHKRFYLEPNLAAYRELSRTAGLPDAVPPLARPAPSDLKAAAPAALTTLPVEVPGVKLSALSLPGQPARNGRFTFLEGPKIGLERGFVYTIRDYPDPFWIGRGTGAGDYDDDGWTDVVFGSDHGPVLYRNVGGRFVHVPLEQPELEKRRVYGVALVDIDGDGWLDLFASTFQGGNVVLLNKGGSFEGARAVPVPNGKGVLTVSPSFGDLDGNGFLDVVNGNMALGIATGFREYGAGRQSSVTWNRGLEFREETLAGPDGEAMASLVSDINNDGLPDVYVSQDFVVPDRFFIGARGGGLRRLEGAALAHFSMPVFSMSADTGDFDNDGRLDFLVTGTLQGAQSLTEPIDAVPATQYKKRKNTLEYCDRIEDGFYRDNCRRNREAQATVPFHLGKSLQVRDCQKLSDASARDSCLLAVMWTIVAENSEGLDCEQYTFDGQIEEVCRLMSRAGRFFDRSTFDGEGRQVDTALLYRSAEDRGLELVTKDRFEHPGGWTWSSRFGDLDSDGWQDILNAEGAVAKDGFGFNVVMHNEGGKRFVQRQFSWGFANDFNLFSFVLVDYDRDGDLDVIGNSSEGPVQVYRNDLARHQNLGVQLRLAKENRFGVGAKVYVHSKKGTLLREMKAGGGYLSFDAPEVHFGLGEVEEVEGLTVVTPAGRKVELRQRLPAGRVYRVEIDG